MPRHGTLVEAVADSAERAGIGRRVLRGGRRIVQSPVADGVEGRHGVGIIGAGGGSSGQGREGNRQRCLSDLRSVVCHNVYSMLRYLATPATAERRKSAVVPCANGPDTAPPRLRGARPRPKGGGTHPENGAIRAQYPTWQRFPQAEICPPFGFI